MKFLLGTKIGMSQIFSKEGKVVPVTVVQAGPIVVTQVRTKEKDGYQAVQIGFGEKKKANKPMGGHLKATGKILRHLREVRGKARESGEGIDVSRVKIGDTFDVSLFKEGDKVRVSALSKGKGFQGAMKLHGFHGAPRTHGTKHAHREVGSIGSTWPQRVLKGKKMAGRMGGDRITVRNLQVMKIDPETKLLAIKGAIPGGKGTVVEIRG